MMSRQYRPDLRSWRLLDDAPDAITFSQMPGIDCTKTTFSAQSSRTRATIRSCLISSIARLAHLDKLIHRQKPSVRDTLARTECHPLVHAGGEGIQGARTVRRSGGSLEQ